MNQQQIANTAIEITRKYLQRLQIDRSRRHQPPRQVQGSFNVAQNIKFLQRLQQSAERMFHYEDPVLQEKALECIPFDRLDDEAIAATKAESGTNYKDEYIKKLLQWFKKDFFTWVNQPLCETCNVKTKGVGDAQPTSEDLKYGAQRVELYQCEQCLQYARFPRYNDPGKLLETRKGRCGEWANAFTLLCRSLGYETRYVVDFTDHVWTEIYSEAQKRWIHCDSCEGAFDEPLMYESGWGKKLTYVFAFSNEEIVDVIGRYTKKMEEVITRRKDVTEDMVKQVIQGLNAKRQAMLSKERIDELKSRMILEQQELQGQHRVEKDEELRGRESGSLEWRLERGETGPKPQ